MARLQIVNAKIPPSAISGFRVLSRSRILEPLVTPKFAKALEGWLKAVAAAVAVDYPRKSGRSAREIISASRVRYGSTLESIRGYFLVSEAIAAQEYGAVIKPTKKRYLTIPIAFALRADGSPKRVSALSWKQYKTFVWTSKKSGQKYIAYKRKGDGKLVLLYVLVDAARIPGRGYIRKAYDKLLPALLASFYAILSQEVDNVYNVAYAAEYAKQGNRIPLPRLAPVKPNALTWSNRLLPRYK